MSKGGAGRYQYLLDPVFSQVGGIFNGTKHDGGCGGLQGLSQGGSVAQDFQGSFFDMAFGLISENEN
jgi:hypothetical protein